MKHAETKGTVVTLGSVRLFIIARLEAEQPFSVSSMLYSLVCSLPLVSPYIKISV